MPYFAGGRDHCVAANGLPMTRLAKWSVKKTDAGFVWRQEKAPTEVGAEVERICKPNDLAGTASRGFAESLNPQLQWTFLILVKVWL
jgi:hypothetical protein